MPPHALDDDLLDYSPPLPIPPPNAQTRTPTLPRSPTPNLSGVSRALAYPRTEHSHSDSVHWAHWDSLGHPVLVLGYSAGVQMWDCNDLSSVSEILSLSLSSEHWEVDDVDFTCFVHAAVISHRPLLGVLMSSHDFSAFFVYSLDSHRIIHSFSFPGVASTFDSNTQYIIISTTLPPAIYIYSATSFRLLSSLSTSSLAPFSPSPSILANVSLSIPPTVPQPPRPVFALSHRLLAYASPQPNQPRRESLDSSPSVPSSVSSQSDIANAAFKVGGTVLSGMKFLGGIAYEAARNRMADHPTTSRFFSRSAPSDERPFAITPPDTVAPDTNHKQSGYYVTVIDLSPLDHAGHPTKVTEIKSSRSQPVANLAFSKDGCQLVCVPENGQVIRVFAIRRDEKSVRIYDLRRGRTSVLVEGVDYARDARWLAVATRNRTLHVFPTNPYGGRPDHHSHLDGKVNNMDQLPAANIEISPLVRLRPMVTPKPDHRVPLAFTFIHPGDVNLPTSLLPPAAPKHTDSPPTSPHRTRRATNIQDILVFDPTDGMLSLRRITVEQRPKDQLSLPTVSVSLTKSSAMGISRSLPGTVGSPGMRSSPGAISRTSSNSIADITMELYGKDHVVATWNLQRKRDWEEIRKMVDFYDHSNNVYNIDWLAQAELSTCSKSPRILPRSIYRSHQFSFFSFCEDYHALLRQYHFNIRGYKIHVHRQVLVSHGLTTTDHYIEDLDYQHRNSFDEPLASALSGDVVEYKNSIQSVLPMYPNGGVSGATGGTKLMRNAIPITRKIGDGMSDGIGRIRREISSSYQRRIRSPSLGPVVGREDVEGLSVPLEFDEEDEDFLGVKKSNEEVGTEEVWNGWESREVKQTVDEMERFDDISVVGFLDEEQKNIPVVVQAQQQKRKKKLKRR